MNKRRARRQLRRLMSEHLESRLPLDATVVFNEIMYHPADGQDDLEFVELHNQMAVDMDISAWRLASGISYEFPEGTIVPGGGYLVIAKDPAALLAGTGVEAMGPYVGSLSNGGEELRLRDRNDREMDRMEYDDRGDWPVGPDGSGVSLAKKDQNTVSDRAANWGSSVVIGGTPGRRNFGSDASASDVTLTLIDTEADWRFDRSESDLGADWPNPALDDSSWSIGAAPFYAGDARLSGATAILIGGVTATASSSLSGHDPSRVVDGSGLAGNTHVVSPSQGTMWLSVATCLFPASRKTSNLRSRSILAQCGRWKQCGSGTSMMSILRPAVPIRALHGPTFWSRVRTGCFEP